MLKYTVYLHNCLLHLNYFLYPLSKTTGAGDFFDFGQQSYNLMYPDSWGQDLIVSMLISVDTSHITLTLCMSKLPPTLLSIILPQFKIKTRLNNSNSKNCTLVQRSCSSAIRKALGTHSLPGSSLQSVPSVAGHLKR